MKLALMNIEEAKGILDECIDLATDEAQFQELTSLASRIQSTWEQHNALEQCLIEELDLVQVQVAIEQSVHSQLNGVLGKLAEELVKFKFNVVSNEFLNIDKLQVTQDGDSKEIYNHSNNMVNIRSENVIKSGVHVMRLQSLNDPGG